MSLRRALPLPMLLLLLALLARASHAQEEGVSIPDPGEGSPVPQEPTTTRRFKGSPRDGGRTGFGHNKKRKRKSWLNNLLGGTDAEGNPRPCATAASSFRLRARTTRLFLPTEPPSPSRMWTVFGRIKLQKLSLEEVLVTVLVIAVGGFFLSFAI
jgi:hypothetical protein